MRESLGAKLRLLYFGVVSAAACPVLLLTNTFAPRCGLGRRRDAAYGAAWQGPVL